jgi:hypothetical protein
MDDVPGSAAVSEDGDGGYSAIVISCDCFSQTVNKMANNDTSFDSHGSTQRLPRMKNTHVTKRAFLVGIAASLRCCLSIYARRGVKIGIPRSL